MDVTAIKYLELAKILTALADLFENTYYKCGAGLQPGTSPAVSFSGIFLFIRNNYFQKHLRVLFDFFY